MWRMTVTCDVTSVLPTTLPVWTVNSRSCCWFPVMTKGNEWRVLQSTLVAFGKKVFFLFPREKFWMKVWDRCYSQGKKKGTFSVYSVGIATTMFFFFLNLLLLVISSCNHLYRESSHMPAVYLCICHTLWWTLHVPYCVCFFDPDNKDLYHVSHLLCCVLRVVWEPQNLPCYSRGTFLF